jgi:hypothetical protein
MNFKGTVRNRLRTLQYGRPPSQSVNIREVISYYQAINKLSIRHLILSIPCYCYNKYFFLSGSVGHSEVERNHLEGEAGEAGALDGEPGKVAPLARPQAVALHLVQAEHRHRRYARQPTHDQAGKE